MKCDIRNHSSMTGIGEVAEKLYNFAQKQLGFDKPARVVFESHGDRAVDMFSPTGSYNPQTKTITIFVDHRHPKDILRSMAHELVHHAQCCQGAFDVPTDTSPGYAQKDDRMRDLERDAYFWGNGILFRDWEDNHKSKRSWDLMNENKKMSLNEQKLRRKIRRLVMESLQEQDLNMADEISQDLANDVEETDIDTSGGFDPTGTSTPPADIDPEIMRAVQDLEEQAVVELDPERPGGVFKPHLGTDPDVDDEGEGNDDEGEGLEEDNGDEALAQKKARHNPLSGRQTSSSHPGRSAQAGHLSDNPQLPTKDAPYTMMEKELEEEQPLKEWYNNTLHEALMKKFKIKK